MCVLFCFGDSITSDQVTGIGTRVGELLNLETYNFAVGYATASDWHNEEENITPISFIEPANTNTEDNVLSNQIRRALQSTTGSGEEIRWRHPYPFGEDKRSKIYSLPASMGTGTGSAPDPDIIYIAIATNDGNQPQNVVTDDRAEVFRQSYDELTRNSLASALRWAIETLICAYPYANIFVASPLQTYCDLPWMDQTTTLLKRDIIKDVARFCGVKFIDSFYESGFNRLVAKEHGEVHPDEGWKENIARFVAGRIAAGYHIPNPSEE